MTHDPTDIVQKTVPRKTHIRSSNRELSAVEGADTIELSPSLKLTNCLFVPSLSHKLFSISHVTKELNCTLLMNMDFCILQDI